MARASIGRAIARAGGWGKKAKKGGKKRAKKGGKKRAKKGGRKKAGKKRAKKGGKKRSAAKRIGKPRAKKSVRKNKSRKKRATTTTFKASGLKIKMKCPPGKAAVSKSAKYRKGQKTYVAIGGRCMAM